MIGKTIAHYRILEKLGEGGMGVVYKAEDTRLGRVVALKFLPAELTRDPDARNRFMQEARAASALDHPNICTIYEISEAEGRTYISMAYYEGETLKDRIARGPLKIEDALDVAVQIAQGLSKAHARGIVHRDIKPANIFITNDGFVKIVDFGVAKLAGMKLTKTGTTLGTARYMSPEQARGEEVDLRSDIWSLGALLYEMITGAPPFRGQYDQAVIYSILNEAPEHVTALRSGVPMALERVVEKALAKSPGERYQHADDLIVDLRQIARSTARDAIAFAREVGAPRAPGSATAPRARGGVRAPGSAPPGLARRTRVLQISAIVVLAAAITVSVYYTFAKRGAAPEPRAPHIPAVVWRNSIAVLPFKDFSQGKDQEYFCDGMTDDIITKLSTIPGLKVISRTSVMRYRDTDKGAAEIGKELGVATILEGSVQRENDRIRINAQLISAAADSHLWAEKYDRNIESLFALQDEISAAIAQALHVTLAAVDQEKFKADRPANLEAYEYCIKGEQKMYAYAASRQESDYEAAVGMFQKAVEKSPKYARAYFDLSSVYLGRAFFVSDGEAAKLAVQNFEIYSSLDPESPETYATKGFFIMNKGDLDGAYRSLKKALEMSPDGFMPNRFAGNFLSKIGLYDQAIPHALKAVELDPLWPFGPALLGVCYRWAGDPRAAASWFEKGLELVPNDPWTLRDYCGFLIQTGRIDRAEELLARARKVDSLSQNNDVLAARILAARGDKDKALALHRDDVVYCLLGMKDEALDALEKESPGRATSYLQLMNDPLYDGLRHDPRFREILDARKKTYEERLRLYGDL